MAEYIERKVLENAMTIAGANGKEKDRRVWARAKMDVKDGGDNNATN